MSNKGPDSSRGRISEGEEVRGSRSSGAMRLSGGEGSEAAVSDGDGLDLDDSSEVDDPDWDFEEDYTEEEEEEEEGEDQRGEEVR